MRVVSIAAALLTASPVSAQLRDLCADRPGLGTPACTVDPGHAVVEIGVVDWTLDRQPGARTDTILSGDALFRFGIDATTEVQVGWTAYGHVRTRDKTGGTVSSTGRTGDVLFAFRKSLSGANGPVAIQPFVTVPAGRQPVGAGDWGAGVLLPFGFDLGHDVRIAFTPEIDAAVDSDGSGRHLAYGNVVGLSAPLTKTLNATAELAATRDENPSGHATTELASVSLAWQPGENTQFDIGTVAGLNAASPDIELYFGIARRF